MMVIDAPQEMKIDDLLIHLSDLGAYDYTIDLTGRNADGTPRYRIILHWQPLTNTPRPVTIH